MASAQVIIKQQDRSTIVPSLPGIYGGIVVRAWKGSVNKPYLVTSENEFIDVFGIPDTRYSEYYSALTYLSQSNKLWVTRAAHEDIGYGGALVRSKIDPIPHNPMGEYTPDKIVKPLDKTLTQEELDAYQFPVYLRDRIYSDTLVSKVVGDSTEDADVRVENNGVFKKGNRVALGDTLDNETPLYDVVNVYDKTVEFDKITLKDTITGNAGDELVWVDNDSNENSYDPKVYLVRDVTDSKDILVNDSDKVHNGDKVKIKDSSDSAIEVDDKSIYTEVWQYIALSDKVTVNNAENITVLVQDEFEERDSFLVTGVNQGKWNNKLSIAITPSRDYENAFNIIVYYDGVQVEKWEVTKEDFIDGFGNQMYLEDKINGKSKYIQVIDNPADTDTPLFTNYSLWRKNSVDVFRDTGITLAEDVIKGDKEVKLSSVDGLTSGDRIKLGSTENEEYKITDISGDVITLDRACQAENYENGSVLYRFDPEYNDDELGIKNGVQYFPIQKIDSVFYNYKVPTQFTISGVAGTLLDAGANMIIAGYNGSTVTTADMVTALGKMSNNEETPITVLMDGGYTIPAYAQELLKAAKKQDLTHVYLSVDPSAENSADYKNAIVSYVSSLAIDTEKASVFTSWVKILDKYNQKYVWVSPESFAAASQSYTYRNYYMWYPAAGWLRGKIVALDSKIKPDVGTRDWLIDNKINPIRFKKGSGFVIWGNRTLYSKPSPLNDRSVAMLLIVIKYGLRELLEGEEFELNTERTWGIVETAVTKFLDSIKAKQGLYDFQVAIKDIITADDIDNNRMPVFVGIKPTRGIKEIPVTLAIYNYGSDIQVQL